MNCVLCYAAQDSYLEWLEPTGLNAGTVVPCDDCSSDEIFLPVQFPFGNYYHSSVYVSHSEYLLLHSY